MVRVRRMTAKDLGAVTGIHRSILREAVRDVGDAELERGFAHLLEGHPEGCLVAVDGRRVVGFIVGSVKPWGFGLGVSGWVEVVGVHPDRMGQGVGRALGLALLEHFASAGVEEVHTAVRWDSGDIIAFFKSIGFDKSDFIHLRSSRGGGRRGGRKGGRGR